MKLRPWLMLALTACALRADADWKALAARFPQAMAVVEDDSETYDVKADGKYVATTHYRATILQEPGIGPLSKYGDSYYEKYDQVQVKRAVVIGPDGRVTPVDPANIKDLPMPAQGPFFLQNVRLVLISFPQLQVGSTVEVDTEMHRNAPPMDHTFSLVEALQGDQPALRQSVPVTLPGLHAAQMEGLPGPGGVHPQRAGRPGHLPVAGGRAAPDHPRAVHAAPSGGGPGPGPLHHPLTGRTSPAGSTASPWTARR